MPQAQPLRAGAAEIDISPVDPQYLCGYSHEPRMSTGVHDPLFDAGDLLVERTLEMLV